MKHDHKIALITGGSRGLGRVMALHLARDGADVILTYRQQQAEAAEVVSQIQALGRKAVALKLDVGVVADFPAFTQELLVALGSTFGRPTFDFLVNNAGIGVNKPFAKTTEADFDSLMNVHFKGVYFLTQSLLGLIADGGRIVNLSSGLTRYVGPGYSAYASMKGAVDTLTKYLAQELGPRGITVNLVAPGITDTDFTQHALNQPGARDFFAKTTALGRVGQPADISGVVNFLCSDDARWISGQRVEASGGARL